ncbi:ArsI/CadI family heavy metal resistance metalloenzyme [Crenobacter sp. SG2305]|uniref:ArsI/CadI family heavy metal resistance metalloenzyme n=1 Tax=Crenobacter oryzisoli TaxID=3056844 RepID=UPI0025AAF74C|nr:ArsI/CadI family heavy metal resistance metalloenzyme [Crenobacter sp. SG2305]MDN0084953.1 ArsI/CadI family heavy metal resistance metalloenzyme [Crenobacter sp. SG2305]
MKRFHVHVAVDNLADSIRFYSALFNAQPTVQKDDYAKWMLEDPRINFAISSRGGEPGLDHLGFQVDSDDELAQLHHQLAAADISMVTQTGTACCYAKSNKHWVVDPSGIAWESYHTLSSIPTFNAGEDEPAEAAIACCAPAAPTAESSTTTCCTPGGSCC